MTKNLLLISCCFLVLAFPSLADEPSDELVSQAAPNEHRYSEKVDRIAKQSMQWRNWLPSLSKTKTALCYWLYLSGNILPEPVAARSLHSTNNTDNGLLMSSGHAGVSEPYRFVPVHGNETNLNTPQYNRPSSAEAVLVRTVRARDSDRAIPNVYSEDPGQLQRARSAKMRALDQMRAAASAQREMRNVEIRNRVQAMTPEQRAELGRRLNVQQFLSFDEITELTVLEDFNDPELTASQRSQPAADQPSSSRSGQRHDRRLVYAGPDEEMPRQSRPYDHRFDPRLVYVEPDAGNTAHHAGGSQHTATTSDRGSTFLPRPSRRNHAHQVDPRLVYVGDGISRDISGKSTPIRGNQHQRRPLPPIPEADGERRFDLGEPESHTYESIEPEGRLTSADRQTAQHIDENDPRHIYENERRPRLYDPPSDIPYIDEEPIEDIHERRSKPASQPDGVEEDTVPKPRKKKIRYRVHTPAPAQHPTITRNLQPRSGYIPYKQGDRTNFFAFTHGVPGEETVPEPARRQLSERNFITERHWRPSPEAFEIPQAAHLQRQGSGDSGFMEATDMEMAERRAQRYPAFPNLEPSDNQPSTSSGRRCRRSAAGACGVAPIKDSFDKKKAIALEKKQKHIKATSFDDLSVEYAQDGVSRAVGKGKHFKTPSISSKTVTRFKTSAVRVTGRLATNLMPKMGLADLGQIGVEGTIYIFQNYERWLTQHPLEDRFRRFDDIYGALSIFFSNPVVELFIPKDMEQRNAKAFVEEQLVWMVKAVVKVEPSYLPELIIPPGPFQPTMTNVNYQQAFQSGLELDAVRDLPVQMAKVDSRKKVFTMKEYTDGSVLMASKPVFANEGAFFLIAKKDDQGNFKPVSMGTGLNILNARLERLEEALIELQKRLAVIQSTYSGHIRKVVKVPKFADVRSECIRKTPNINLQGPACSTREIRRKINKIREDKREADQQNNLYESHLQAITDGIVKSLLEEHARLAASIGELKTYAGASPEASSFQQRMQSLIDAGHFHELEREARAQSLQEIHDIPEAGSDEAQSNRQKVYAEIEKASRSIDRFVQNIPRHIANKLLNGMEGISQCSADNPFIEIKKQLLTEALAVPDEITIEKIELPFHVAHDPPEYLHNYVLGPNGILRQFTEGLVPESIDEGKIFYMVYEGPRETRLRQPLKHYFRYSTDRAIKAFFAGQPINQVASGQALHFATVSPANGHVQHWQQFAVEEVMEPKMCPEASSSQAPRKILRELTADDQQSFTNAALVGNHYPRLVVKRSGEASSLIGSMLAPVLSLQNAHFNSSGYLRVPFYKYPNGHLYPCQTSGQTQETVNLDRYEVHWPETSLPQLHKIEMANDIETTRLVEADISWDFARDNRKIILNRHFLSELGFYPKGELQPGKAKYQTSVRQRFLHMRCHWSLSINDSAGTERIVARFKIDDDDIQSQHKEITLTEPLEPDQENALVFSCQYRARQSLLPNFWRYNKKQEKRVRISANLAPGFYRLQGGSHSEKLVVTQHNWQEQISPANIPANANRRLIRQKTKLPRYADRRKLQNRKHWKAFFNTLGDSVPETGNFQESGIFLYKRVRLENGTIQFVPREYVSKELAVVSRPRSIRHLMECLSHLSDLDRDTFDLIVQVAIGIPRRYQQQFITEYFQNPAQQMSVVDNNTGTDHATNSSQTMPAQSSTATDSAPAASGHINRKLMAQEVFGEEVENETTNATNQAQYNTASIAVPGLAIGAGLLINGLDLTTDAFDREMSCSSALITKHSLSRWLYINQSIFECGIQAYDHADNPNERLQAYTHDVYSRLVAQGLGNEIITLPMIDVLESLHEMPVTQFYDFIHQHSRILVAEQPESSDVAMRVTEECPIAPYSILCELFKCSSPLRKKFDQVAIKLQQLGIEKGDITLRDILGQITHWEDFPEINLPLTIYRNFKQMTVITAVEATLLLKKRNTKEPGHPLFDAHGEDYYQMLLKMKEDSILSEDVTLQSSVYGFFQQKIVKDLLHHFYSKCYFSLDDESIITKKRGCISDIDFYKAVNSPLRRKKCHMITQDFLNGCYTSYQGEYLSIMDVPDALIKKYMTVALDDEQPKDENSIKYKKIRNYIGRCRAQLAFILAELSKDPNIYLPALPGYKANDNGNIKSIAAQFFPLQNHSGDRSLITDYSGMFEKLRPFTGKPSVSAWRLMKMNESMPCYFRKATFMYSRRSH